MKAWQIVAGLGLAVGVGAAVFLGTRKASAAAAGTKALRVDAGCTKVEAIDVDTAKSAIQSAALAEFHSKDEPAIDYVTRIAKLVLGCTPKDTTVFVGVPGSANTITWGQLRSQLGSMTVGTLASMASGAIQAAGIDFKPTPVSLLSSWLISADLRQTLYRLALVVPVPVAPNKYDVGAPSGAHVFEWGDGLYVITKANPGWHVTPWNTYYADSDIGIVPYSSETYQVADEASALYLAFLENDGDMGAQA